MQSQIRVLPPYGGLFDMKKMKNFNSVCRKSGLDYENAVIAHEILVNNSNVVGRNVTIPECGIEMDIVINVPLYDKKGTKINSVVKYVQAKGGRPGESLRPGAKRTDSVKKALADGTLLKVTHPDCRFVLYFSEPPKEGSSSDKMIRTALDSGIVDEVHYVGYEG